jgi:hypothetical protein
LISAAVNLPGDTCGGNRVAWLTAQGIEPPMPTVEESDKVSTEGAMNPILPTHYEGDIYIY